MVIGLEEPILIKGIGEIIAKIDSGNSGYNVIHGEDLTVQGNILTFKTVNKDGDDRRVSKKIKETINVNIGGGHIQERPVVELDVQFGGQEYKKVLFSVTDRSGNDNKVLISKDFVGKELDALIDVTKNKIADDGVEVEYVSEGIRSTLGGLASAAGDAIGNKLSKVGNAYSNSAFSKSTAGKVVNGIGKWAGKKINDGARRTAQAFGVNTDVKSNIKKGKKVNGVQQYKVTSNKQKKGNFADRLEAAAKRWKQWVHGEVSSLFDDTEEFVEAPALLEKFLKSDADAIKKEVAKNKKLFEPLSVNTDDVQVYKILDFLGGTCAEGKYGDEVENNETRDLMAKLKAAQKEIEDLKKQLEEAKGKTPAETTEPADNSNNNNEASNATDTQTNNTEEEEEFITEADDTTDNTAGDASSTSGNGEAAATDSNSTAADKLKNNQNPEARLKTLQKDVEGWKEKLSQYMHKRNERDYFVIYYAAFGKTADGKALAKGKEIIGEAEPLILQNAKNLMSQKLNEGILEQFISTIKPSLNKNTRGVFAFCTGPNIPRPVTLVKKALIGEEAAAESNGGESSAQGVDDAEMQELVDKYKKISDKVMAIADDLGQEHDEVDEEYINTLIELAGGEATERSPEMEEFIQKYSELNARFHEIAEDMVSPEQMLDEQLINDLIEMGNEFSGEMSTKEAQNDPGDQWNDEDYYDWENRVENEEEPLK